MAIAIASTHLSTNAKPNCAMVLGSGWNPCSFGLDYQKGVGHPVFAFWHDDEK